MQTAAASRIEKLTTQPRLVCIPQGVDMPQGWPLPSWASSQISHLKSLRSQSPMAKFCLLVAGLRPVKDVLFLADCFDDHFEQQKEPAGPKYFLLLVGPVMEVEYGDLVKERLKQSQAVKYLGLFNREWVLQAIRDADCVVNTSCSEGCAGALVEAMALGTPVLARDIPGNRALLESYDNLPNSENKGSNLAELLFDTSAAFLDKFKRLCSEEAFRTAVLNKEKELVSSLCAREREAWQSVLRLSLNN